MRLLFTLLIALVFAGSAVADQVPETPVLTGPNFQQVPASDILVLPTGGTLQTLGDALATTQPGSNVSNSTVTATGTPTARTTANRAADVVNVKDYGAVADATITSTLVTMTSGSADLVTTTPIFSAASVGKTVVVGSAGTAPTTGGVLVTPVSTAGSGYTSVPTCAITDASSSGSGATCSALMSVVSATVTTGGSGCTNGTATFLVGTDGTGTPTQVTGTVTAGALAGALTVTTAGLYSALPTLAAATAYGNACTVAPTLALVAGVAAVQVTAQGTAYSTTQTTAALSGGSPSVAGTMGAVQIGAVTPPLKSTVAAYISPTHVTLAATAGRTLSSSTQQVLVGTDNAAAFQSAINAAAGIYIPPGTYWIGSVLDPGRVARTFRGEGMYNTILVWDSGTSTSQNSGDWVSIFKNITGSASSPTGYLQMSNFQIRGLLDFGRSNTGGAALQLYNYIDLNFSNMRFYQVPWMAMQNESNSHFEVINSEFDTVMRDQARCRSCFSVRIIGNHFLHSDDDSVAIHQANYINGAGIIGEGVVVSGNDFEDTAGIHILHAWKVAVTSNTLRRTKVNTISIGNDANEGTPPQLGILVADNHITDALATAPFLTVSSAAISVRFSPPAYVTGDATLLPGSPINGTAFVPKPWDYSTSSVVGGTSPVPSARGVIVHDNVYIRTLPAVAHYSDWGYGQALSHWGFINPPMPDTSLVPTAGIALSVNTPTLQVHDNSISNVRRGITVNDTAVANSQIKLDISHNQILDAWEYGIVLFGSGNATHMSMIGNQIDVDPYFVSPGRSGGHGGWSNAYSASRCFLSNTLFASFVMAENEFANCYAIQQPTSGVYYGNVVHGRPAVGSTGQITTWSSVNFGIGVYPNMGGPGFTFFQTNSDPTAQLPTQFEQISSTKTTFAAAAPSSGWHVINDVIYSTAPGTCTCVGWLMLTTGTGWVSGTDYKVIPIS